jgi:hypothetical protein
MRAKTKSDIKAWTQNMDQLDIFEHSIILNQLNGYMLEAANHNKPLSLAEITSYLRKASENYLPEKKAKPESPVEFNVRIAQLASAQKEDK